MSRKILILAGGGVKHLQPFLEEGRKLALDIVVASFSKLEYETAREKTKILVDGEDIADFGVVYLRLVGKRFEDAALVVHYAKQKGVKIVDAIYEREGIVRLPLPKSIEAKILADNGLPIPKTYFARMKRIAEVAPRLLGFPFVIKGTMGRQGHAIWLARNREELNKLVKEFTPNEKHFGCRFIAQKFTKASQRNRIFVIGEKIVGGITRPTRWRKIFQEKIRGKSPEGIKAPLNPVPRQDTTLAIAAAKAVSIDIAGVDIITEDKTSRKYVLEVNSAPRWASLKRDTGVNIEREILKYLAKV